MSKDNDPSGTQLMPFKFASELVDASHSGILLSRDKVDGVLSSELKVFILKAREGETGQTRFNILPGYQLIPC